MPNRRSRLRTPHYDRRRRVVKLGAGGPWWDPSGEKLCIWAAYQPVGAGNFAASLIDRSGNGNDAGDPGGAATPPWDAVNGWRPDGIADYLTTTFVPQNDQSQSALVQFTNVTNAGMIFGVTNGGIRHFIIHPDTGGASVRYYNGNAALIAPAQLAGNLGLAGAQGYRNGVANGGAIPGWGGASTRPTYIGARNNVGVLADWIACNIQALAFYDCVLTAPQMLAIETAMAAL